MSRFRIKISEADRLFSLYIRHRDGFKCARCHRIKESAQNSHFFGRGMYSTRFDETNCTTLCWSCHDRWGGQDRREYENYMIKWLGKKGFAALNVRAHCISKRPDEKLIRIWCREKLKELGVDGF